MKLILASGSPRRHELLRNAGIAFEARPGNVDESVRPGEAPDALALRLAQEKSLEAAASAPAGSFVLGADTVVSADGGIFNKPADAEDAARMLRALSGSTHRVITGVSVVRAPGEVLATEREITFVTFRALDDREIRDYVASGEPFDKAGGYAIQGLASKFVTRIEGCYFNVVGLPLSLVYQILKPYFVVKG